MIVDEPARARLLDLLENDSSMIVWWGSPVECVSAIARREREGAMSVAAVTEAIERLDALANAWNEVLPSDPVRDMARRLLRVHSLRASGALQLAAAIVAAEHDPPSMEFLSLDDRLNDAARREGFRATD